MRELLTVSPELADVNRRTIIEHATDSFLHGLIQTPLSGTAQLVDKVAGTDILPKVQIVSPQREASFGTAEWHAQTIGSTVGMLPWFIGLHKASSAVMNGAMRLGGRKALAEAGAAVVSGEAAAGRTAERFLGQKTLSEVGAATLTGLSYGAIFMPVAPSENFWHSRGNNALSTALTFATLTGTARYLHTQGLKNHTLSGMISGIPAGLVGAESQSRLAGKGGASFQELGKSVYAFSMIGGGLGYAQGRLAGRTNVSEVKESQTSGASPAVTESSIYNRVVRAAEAPNAEVLRRPLAQKQTTGMELPGLSKEVRPEPSQQSSAQLWVNERGEVVRAASGSENSPSRTAETGKRSTVVDPVEQEMYRAGVKPMQEAWWLPLPYERLKQTRSSRATETPPAKEPVEPAKVQPR